MSHARSARRMSLALLAVSLLGCVSAAPPPPAPGATFQLPGDDNQFTRYDLRQAASGPVDWPVTFVFRGNASIDRIRTGLCQETQHPWKYCDRGGSMYLFARGRTADEPFSGFIGDGGLKRFRETCATNDFTAHLRLYAPPAGSFASATYGRIVVATAHLDFQDKVGCSGRVHGYSDVAEAWFIEAMRTIPGWEVHADHLDLGNANETFVVMRDVAGADVPHVYQSDRLATEVVIA